MMMKRMKCLLLVLCVATAAMAQTGYYTRQFNDKKLERLATLWMKGGMWREGFRKADPHATVNAVEFYTQYEKNPEQWKALFRWLDETNLMTIPAGKYPIEGTSLVASVEDSQNAPLAKRQSESHYHHIDFQYVVRGIERFGIIDHETSRPNSVYKPDVIHYYYDLSKTRFYDSTPYEFFIFFPSDWHIAKIENDTGDQDIRVIVIKLDYID